MCILPLIYLFICTAHLNKRANREATSARQRSHFLTQENCFLAGYSSDLVYQGIGLSEQWAYFYWSYHNKAYTNNLPFF